MTDPYDLCLHEALSRLRRAVELLNAPQNLDGLLAIHFGANSGLERAMDWKVCHDPVLWVQQNEARLDQAPKLAVLGCLLAEQTRRLGSADVQLVGTFRSHLGRLQQRRDVFLAPNSWALQPDLVLSVVLGIRAIADPSAATWAQRLLQEGVNRQDTPLFLRLAYQYALFLLETNQPYQPQMAAVEPRDCSLVELALTIWLTKRDILRPGDGDRDHWLDQAQSVLVGRLISEAPCEALDYKAALVWEVVTSYVETRSQYPRLDLVIALLQNFPAAMERWQDKWTITDEYDIQALLWLILRPSFDDLHYEEYLPKLGRSGARYDLGLPPLGLIIEVKYVRKGSDFQKIVDEIGKDSAQLRPQSVFTGMVVFVYDATCSGEQHDWVRRTLESIALVKKAILVSAPSTCRR